MELSSNNELKSYLKSLKYIDQGSQGVCFYCAKDNKVYKVFSAFFEDDEDEDYDANYSDYDILKFSDIDNSTFIWPKDTIKVAGNILGYECDFFRGKNLYKINPFLINLKSFANSVKKAKQDVQLLTYKGIELADTVYNTLYNGKDIAVIDTLEYFYSSRNTGDLHYENMQAFDYGIYYFLIEDYFNTFVENDKILREMYLGDGVDILDFISVFNTKLSEAVGREVVTLGDARELRDKNSKRMVYARLVK